jgi:2,4-didehydro-3-deoxy-L-rhamnonate hydrolase
MPLIRKKRYDHSRPSPHRYVSLAALLTLPLACTTTWEPLFDEPLEPTTVRNVEISNHEEALTFFRVPDARSETDLLRLFAATSYENERVSGVDLSAALGADVDDPIEAFNRFGYAELARVVEAGDVEDFAVSELTLPVNLGDHHVAAGTNFPEHASETGVAGGPYLFPKLTSPTRHDATVSAGRALLDYEVEVGWVPLQPIERGSYPEFVGMILCNDYTDRDTLLRHIDTSNVASGDGFTTAKSFPGFLPVGNLFVIPRDRVAFEENVLLKLAVNGWLRQREHLRRRVWGIDEILDQSWAREKQTWDHRGEAVSLFSKTSDAIAERTLLMSGTPSGVVFNELNVEQKGSGFFDYVLGGWDESIPDHAVDNYIRDARGAGIYLHVGDEVVIHANHLGVIRNEVVQ